MAQALACLFLVAAAVALPGAVVDLQPAVITLDGGPTLPRAGEARRVHLLGAVELYTVALYAELPDLNRASLASPDVAKVLRIHITYDEGLRRRVPNDWRRELVPPLEPPGAATHIRGTFAPLRQGDVVVIEYVPARGTVVRVKDAVAVPDAHHDLMLAFLDHWLGQRPVSEEMKRALLGSS